MNKEQKQQIRKLRGDGHGYAAIANALGLTKNQVSAFCRRNNLTGKIADTGDENTPDVSYCQYCGKPIKQIPGRKEVRFCSDACRKTTWRATKGNRKGYTGRRVLEGQNLHAETAAFSLGTAAKPSGKVEPS